MKVQRTRNKLLKNGFIAKQQNGRHDLWVDIQGGGTDISFFHDGEKLDGRIKVLGRQPDQPQFDNFYSSYVESVKNAIMLSRV